MMVEGSGFVMIPVYVVTTNDTVQTPELRERSSKEQTGRVNESMH